ncbi:MocR-like pyridoxine biosynthesis transcription factor PdxR [Paenibacillus wynnii]|uniref:MocR-like pyridoxine biosynthesis transcription factor PdxR n=1 Tax=Paenibacillus wynnii TaxID=268407 RepID=UPI002791CE99|nr:PLP-dependent aminotransferase family protein [Paenibacillus wynnii]MDQ0196483.1 GntR family transcriptional regulator/MocR family aminotransferase [Paenibacillus wynnii]
MRQELLITLSKRTPIPLSRQVYEQIRSAIISGLLHSGDPIPPSRLLANQLEVSRTVVLNAYEQLQAEGYIQMRKGAGTFVAENAASLFASKLVVNEEEGFDEFINAPDFMAELSSPYSGLLGVTHSVPYDFRHGVPAWSAFPMDRWQKSVVEACRNMTPDMLTYGPAEGTYHLREEIARLVRSTRSIPAMPEQIVITSGATQALDILARLCLHKGEQVVVEDPSHTVLREIFSFSGAEVLPVAVDGEGLCVDRITPNKDDENRKGLPRTKLVYVTPSHQFPLGVTMSLNRRIELLRWARSNDALIIEDDYDSEYRYVGQKVSALAGLDTSGRVIYIGSFSKTLFPALRIGYAILPQSLIEPFLAIKWITDRMTSTLEQKALAEFIKSGYYAKHVYKMGKLYAGRRSCLVASLKQEFGDRIRYFGDEAGLHLLIELESKVSEEEIAKQALHKGVKVYPASNYFAGDKPNNPTFLLGYSNLTRNQIQTGIQIFAQAERFCKVKNKSLNK